jgi:hypothetical protein
MSDDDEPGQDVMSSLPRSRPHRRSARRSASGGDAAPASPRARKPAATAKAKPAGEPKRAAKAKPAAEATPAPAAETAPEAVTAGPRPAHSAPAPGAGDSRGRGPSAVRPSAATHRARTGQTPTPARRTPAGAPSGADLLGTALQAAGELAEIGLKLGTQAIRTAASRIPRP